MSKRDVFKDIFFLIGLLSAALLALFFFGVLRFCYAEKTLLYCTAGLFLFAGARLQCSELDGEPERRKRMRQVLALLFGLYAIVLVDFTMIDDSLGRSFRHILSGADTLSAYWRSNTNFRPFATISIFITGLKGGKLTLGSFIMNIWGNLIAFMPLSFFLPVFCKKIDRPQRLLGCVAGIVAAVECLQLLFRTGSCDIDDLILNSLGAMAFYFLITRRSIAKGLSKLTFGVWEYEK